MEATILLLADFANTDASGKLNIIGSFNQVRALNFPTQLPQMHLVIQLVAGLGEFEKERKLEIALFDADGGKLFDIPNIPVKVKSPNHGRRQHHNILIGLQQMPIQKPGAYAFMIYLDGDLKGEIPLDVFLREQPDSDEQ